MLHNVLKSFVNCKILFINKSNFNNQFLLTFYFSIKKKLIMKKRIDLLIQTCVFSLLISFTLSCGGNNLIVKDSAQVKVDADKLIKIGDIYGRIYFYDAMTQPYDKVFKITIVQKGNPKPPLPPPPPTPPGEDPVIVIPPNEDTQFFHIAITPKIEFFTEEKVEGNANGDKRILYNITGLDKEKEYKIKIEVIGLRLREIPGNCWYIRRVINTVPNIQDKNGILNDGNFVSGLWIKPINSQQLDLGISVSCLK